MTSRAVLVLTSAIIIAGLFILAWIVDLNAECSVWNARVEADGLAAAGQRPFMCAIWKERR